MTESIRLNTLSGDGRKDRKRVGRGIGSGFGKTAGRGHKGQRSRSGGRRDGNFEGGQMPLYRRVPKRGFNSRMARETMSIRLNELNALKADEISVSVLREIGFLPHNIKRVRIFNSGEINRSITISGIHVTKGAIVAIEKAGGKILQETPNKKPVISDKTGDETGD